MTTVLEIILLNILKRQFTNESEGKRIIIDNIPTFIQEKLYDYIIDVNPELDFHIVFTKISRPNVNNVLIAQRTGEILDLRNLYAINNLAIFTTFPLDRSNESAISELNACAYKWNWIDSLFGNTLVNDLFDILGVQPNMARLIKEFILYVGEKSEDGLNRQWQLIENLSNSISFSKYELIDRVSLALGLPKSVKEDLDDSLAILNSNYKFLNQPYPHSIATEIEVNGLIGFKNIVEASINSLSLNQGSLEYQLLFNDLIESGYEVSNGESFRQLYSIHFQNFYGDLVQRSISSFEISNSINFYLLPKLIHEEQVPEYWKLLNCNFWRNVLTKNRRNNTKLDIKILNLLPKFGDHFKDFDFTTANERGKISFKISDFDQLNNLRMLVDNESLPVISDSAEWVLKGKINKPLTITFKEGIENTKTFKVIPFECFELGIFPIVINDSKTHVPIEDDNEKWVYNIDVNSNGQAKIIILVNLEFNVEKIWLTDEKGENLEAVPSKSIKIEGVQIFETNIWIDREQSEKIYTLTTSDDNDINVDGIELRLNIENTISEEYDSYLRKYINEHLNRKKGSAVFTPIRSNFIDQFEIWCINNLEISHKPISLSICQVENFDLRQLTVDYNGWRSLIPGITCDSFCHLYSPSTQLLNARTTVLKYLLETTSTETGGYGLLRNIDIATFDDSFEILTLEYLSAYYDSLISDRSATIWFDIHPILYDRTKAVDLLSSKDILGFLVSPFHPLRLYWQLRTQWLLKNTSENIEGVYRFCPAASVIDPSIVPDILCVDLKSVTGTKSKGRFISLTNDSDYWGVLVRADNSTPFFNPENDFNVFWGRLGIKVEGLNQGLFPSQIERSLKDVSRLMASKDKLRVTLQGDTKGYEEDGILNWLKNTSYRTNGGKKGNRANLDEYIWSTLREKSLEVFDKRPLNAQPDDYFLYDQYIQVNQNLKWFNAFNTGHAQITDLSIVSNIGLSDIELEEVDTIGSPAIGPLLYKQRLTKVLSEGNQVPLQEQRKTAEPINLKNLTDQKFIGAILLLEGGPEEKITCLAMSPRIDLLKSAIEQSHLSVVSSSVITPATFSIMARMDEEKELLLWDFDLPSFNNTSNTKNGYYLLAHPNIGSQTSSISSSLTKYLNLFSKYRNLEAGKQVEFSKGLLLEYISKGLPSLKKLIYGGNAFRGEIGNILALRILQGTKNDQGITTLITDSSELSLIVPVDPFQEIIEKMPREEGDDRSRPDLLVISMFRCESGLRIKMTPVEVKFRTSHDPNWKDHLIQATKFSKFLRKVYDLGNNWELWRIAFASIVGRMIEYGLHISSNQITTRLEKENLYKLGFELISELFNPQKSSIIEFDPDGRLIYINAGENNIESVCTNSCLYLNNSHSQQLLFDEQGIRQFRNHFSILESGWSLLGDCNKIEIEANEIENIDNEKSKDEAGEKVHIVPLTPTQIEELDSQIDNNSYLKNFPEGLNVQVGTSENTYGKKKYYYNPGSTDVNQLNIGVIGDLGTGKTQLLKSLVYSISQGKDSNRGHSPKFLILDTKRDYDGSGNELDKRFITEIGAEVLFPYKIKLNIFDIRDSGDVNPALTKARFFIDVLNKIYGGIGPIQKDQLLDAIMTAFKNRGYNSGLGQNYLNFASPTLIEIRDVYKEMVKQTDAPLSIMNSLIIEELFEEQSYKTVSFKELFKNSIVVALGRLASSADSLKLTMVIFLKLYQEYMLSVEKAPYIGNSPSLRKVDSFILIDEAKLIMDYDFQVLEDLLRKGREFGVGVILSTQYLSDFTGGKIDYKQPLSTWFIHKVPNISLKELKSIGIVNVDEKVVSSVISLEKHYCLYKTVKVDGKLIRGIPLYELLT